MHRLVFLSIIYIMNDTINKIIKLYDLNKKEIDTTQLKYYHLDINNEYQPTNMNHPMFYDVHEYNYTKPIKILSEYFKNTIYYKNIYNKIKNINENKAIHKIPNYYKLLNDIELDDFVLQYIKCRSTVHIIFLFDEMANYLEKISDKLNYEYPIYYIKQIKLNKVSYKKLLYEIYDIIPLSERMNKINKQKINKINEIGIIWIDNNTEEKYKKFYNNIIENIQQMMSNKLNNNTIFITTYFHQMIEISEILLNKNSINMLSYSEINIYDKSFLLFNTFRHWCYSNFTLLDMTRMVAYGSLLLYCLGIRDIKNINGILIPLHNKNQTELELEELINFNLTHKIPFIDLAIEDSASRSKLYHTEMKNFIKKLNMSFSEIAINPKYHWYYKGIKLYLFDFEIQKKIHNIQNKKSLNDLSDIVLLYFNNRLLLKNYVKMKNNKLLLLNNNINENIINNLNYKLIKKRLDINNFNISLNTLKDIL